jgi:hypothetical protein
MHHGLPCWIVLGCPGRAVRHVSRRRILPRRCPSGAALSRRYVAYLVSLSSQRVPLHNAFSLQWDAFIPCVPSWCYVFGFHHRHVLSGERIVPRGVPVRVVLWSGGHTPHGLSSRHTLVQHRIDDRGGMHGIWYVSIGLNCLGHCTRH